MSVWSCWKRLEPRSRIRLAAATGLTLAACGLAIALPLLMQRILAQAEILPTFSDLGWPAAALLGAAALHSAASAATGWLLGAVAIDAGSQLRQALYVRLQRLPLAWFDRMPAGAVISRMMDDVAVVQSLAGVPVLVTLVEVAAAIGAGLWIGRQSGRLAACLGLLAALYALVFWLYVRPIHASTRSARQRLDEIFSHLKQKLDGVLVLRATGQEAHETAGFTRQMAELHQPRLRLGGLTIAFTHCCGGLGGLGSALIFGVGAGEVIAGRMSVGGLIAATMMAGLLLSPLPRLAELAALLQQARASRSRLAEIFDVALAEAVTPLPAPARAGNGQAGSWRGEVRLQNIDFSYGRGVPALSNLSLAVPAGQRLAIVGPTGSGKSTLVHLLLKFYEPASGEILLDGRPLSQIPAGLLRQAIGFVPQEAAIFRGTLADNIRYGTPHATADAVEAAARGALVHELALRLPQQYDTLIGEGGHPLSQGERQRIAIARILCKNPAIVVLDEATSMLDAASEALVRRALGRLFADRTIIAIAHRLETIQSADRIVVLDGGRIVQDGTHDELVADGGGLYRRLSDAQQPARQTPRSVPTSFEPVAA